MLACQVKLGDTADNGTTIDHADDAIIQATINTVRNPGAAAAAQLAEETDVVLHSLYFFK